MKIVVLTTSYPTAEHPVAGNFVRTSVELAREAGNEVTVVSPESFSHFGIAYGGGIANNLRGAPWKLALVPAFLAAFARAARAAARDADLVHAHWIPSAVAARASGTPYVLQVWGTDVALARKAPALVRPLLRGARTVVAASSYLADAARELGARRVEIVPTPVPLPDRVPEPEDPAHVLFAGRLSAEKGILEFLEATEHLPRVIVGDGPLRDRVGDRVGAVAPASMGEYYARAAVVCVPSLREGYGMVAREGMAYGRPVVASAVGGLVDAIDSGRTGFLVRPGDPAELRRCLTELLDDPARRQEVGAAARESIEQNESWAVARDRLETVYREAIR